MHRDCSIMLIAGILARAEKSGIWLIDNGPDGTSPKVIWDHQVNQWLAGSMGLIIQYNPEDRIRSALQNLAGNHVSVIKDLFNLASCIFQNWPIEDIALRPNPVHERNILGDISRIHHPEEAIIQITKDLIQVAPLISGIWPSSFGVSSSLDLQTLFRQSFASFRMRDFEDQASLEEDNHAIVRLYMAIIRILEHPVFPVWTVHLLEDVFAPPIREIIRWVPRLFHLRNTHHFGNPPSLIASNLREYVISEATFHQLLDQMEVIMASVYPVTDLKITFEQQLIIRNLGTPSDPQDQLPIEGRDDLDVSKALIRGDLPTAHVTKADYIPFASMMSNLYDIGKFPPLLTIFTINRNPGDPTTRGYEPIPFGIPFTYQLDWIRQVE